MLLEMKIFDFLPAGHHSGASADSDVSPHGVEVAVVDDADVFGFVRECGELIALEVVVVVSHCVRKTTDDGFGNICITSQYVLGKAYSEYRD